jgi:hypothetical protein
MSNTVGVLDFVDNTFFLNNIKIILKICKIISIKKYKIKNKFYQKHILNKAPQALFIRPVLYFKITVLNFIVNTQTYGFNNY